MEEEKKKLVELSETLSPADKKAAIEKQAQVVLDSLPSKPSAALSNDQGTNDTTTVAASIASAESKPAKKVPSVGSFTSKTDDKVGWNAFSKLPNPGDEQSLEVLAKQLGLDTVIDMYKGVRTSTVEKQDVLSQFLKEAYYGEWYHNTAAMLFTVVFTWFLTKCGGGLMACLVVGAFLATYYQTSIRRLRRNVRDDIQRELSIHRLESESETADWINHFMSRSIGICTFDLKTLKENDNLVDGLSLSVMKKGKICGEVKVDLHYFPVNLPDKNEDGTVIPPKESNSGILRFSVHECKELVGKSDISPYAVVKINGQERLRTNPFKRSVNPRWDKSVELFVTDKTSLNLDVEIRDDSIDNRILGRWQSTLEQFEEDCFINQQDWWTLKDGAGKVHLSMQWKHITMTGFTEQSSHGAYRPPIGVVRVHVESADDLKNVEAMTGGKSDPYVRLLVGTQNRGQTDYFDDTLCPVWNQVLYVPVHSKREDLVLEVMDYNDNTKDKSLGLTDLLLEDIMKEIKTEDGQVIYEALEPVTRNVELMTVERTKGRGTLRYSASFFPTLALAKEPQQEKEQEPTTADEEQSNGSQVSEEPEMIDKPKELPEKDLHQEIIRYKDDKIDLIKYESGVLAVTVQSLTLPESTKVTVDLSLDSTYPQFRTLEHRDKHIEINETGTLFVKELDFSKLLVRVRKVKEDEKDDKSILGRCTLEVRKIVEQLMEQDEPATQELSLLECPSGLIRLSFRYVPVVQFKLDPSESLENQGNLTVALVKASNLTAADRSGTKDAQPSV
ncbi:hypothetical protein RMCBS344292_10698 [Rhizopus microsporus]|nr:hypothetical protein RMCBS344292_10698 [Rhizopus microsporus]